MTRATLLTAAVLGVLASSTGEATDRGRLTVSASVIRSSRIEVSAARVGAHHLVVSAPGLVSVEQKAGATRTALRQDAAGAWRLSGGAEPVVVTVLADAR